MRHNVAGRKLGKKTQHRLAMLRNMSASLIEHGRIQTTLHKAKELKKVADKLVTLGKTNTVHARRQAFDYLRNRGAVQKLFNEIAPAFTERLGGYTRIYHLGSRVGDAAKVAIIEYLQEDILKAKVEGKVSEKKKKTEKKAKTTKKTEEKKAISAKKETKTKENKTTKKEAAPKKEAKTKKTTAKKAEPKTEKKTTTKKKAASKSKK